MFILKPFLRITILSIILASLLIYLGVKYHWGDTLKRTADTPINLTLPEQSHTISKDTKPKAISKYDPVIINNQKANTVLESMNKEQIAEYCINLLSKQLKDPLSLEIATANCVVSNYDETFQNLDTEIITADANKQDLQIVKECELNFAHNNAYSPIERQLLVGICVSDNQTKIND